MRKQEARRDARCLQLLLHYQEIIEGSLPLIFVCTEFLDDRRKEVLSSRHPAFGNVIARSWVRFGGWIACVFARGCSSCWCLIWISNVIGNIRCEFILWVRIPMSSVSFWERIGFIDVAWWRWRGHLLFHSSSDSSCSSWMRISRSFLSSSLWRNA